MKNIFIALMLMSIISFFASCEKELQYRGEYLESIITIVSVNSVSDSLYCNVSKTNFFLEENKVWTIDDPVVCYSVNSGDWQEMTIESQTSTYVKYISDYIIQPSDEVALKVTHPDYTTATTTQVAPEYGNITIEKFEKISNGEYRVTVKFYPYDVDYQNDMLYSFSMRYYYTVSSNNGDTTSSKLTSTNTFTSSDPLVLNAYGEDDYFFSGDTEQTYGVLYFYPSLITEPYEFTFTVGIDCYYCYDLDEYTFEPDKLYAKLYIMPESYLKYLDTKSDNYSLSLFSESVQLYNNIEDGVGNFTIYSSAVDSLSIVE